ncbi:hypothetical protein [Tropicimonas sp. IMCC34011]|uniref:hypothetical protein n=1 Tax=Tropicimonas sp. IMCC34011 TaxID=2248759 RepID=UPI000E227989|nr:hypothetical protein [Tropicimonas sp. IMCC34011]
MVDTDLKKDLDEMRLRVALSPASAESRRGWLRLLKHIEQSAEQDRTSLERLRQAHRLMNRSAAMFIASMFVAAWAVRLVMAQ